VQVNEQPGQSCGPTRYPDHELTSVIHAALLSDFRLGRSEISVAVSNGVVQLNGSVNSKTARDDIEGMVRKIPGVVNILNQITVVE
jgi:osmotically-inducible protein OsmY